MQNKNFNNVLTSMVCTWRATYIHGYLSHIHGYLTASGNPTLSVTTLSRHMQLPLPQLPLPQLFGPQDLLSLVPELGLSEEFPREPCHYACVRTCMYLYICIGMPITIHIYTTQEPLISIHAHMFAFQYPYDYMHVEYQPKGLRKVHTRTYLGMNVHSHIIYLLACDTHVYTIYHA